MRKKCTCNELERVAGHFCDACKRGIQREIAPTPAELELTENPREFYEYTYRQMFPLKRLEGELATIRRQMLYGVPDDPAPKVPTDFVYSMR